MGKIFKIELTKNKSKNFIDVLTMMEKFPHFKIQETDTVSTYFCWIENEIEYINNYLTIEQLFWKVYKWKNCKVYLNGDLLRKYLYQYREFQNKMDNQIKEMLDYDYKPLKGEVAHNIVSFDENLIYPLTYYPPVYGVFFVFGEKLKEQPFFCECQKETVRTFFDLYGAGNKREIENHFPTSIIRWIEEATKPFNVLEFRKNICHRCLNTIPKYNYCHAMYGSIFKQKHGWFIKQKYIDYGIFADYIKGNIYDRELCPNDLIEMIDLRKDISNKMENIVRKEFGYALIGESWLNETMMFKILEKIYPEYTIQRHYRPRWLQGLEIDAFIKELNIGFEYNGKQHYEPVEFWGGLEKLKNQQDNDFKKNELCEKLGVTLITIKYTEKLSENLIVSKLKQISNQK